MKACRPIVVTILWLCVGLAIGLMILNGILMAAYPLQLDYGEGAVLQLSDACARGQHIYRDPQQYPWLISQYTPLYIYSCALLQRLSGVGLGPGRLLSLLSALGCCALVFAAARRHAGTFGGLVALCCFAISPLTVGWSAMYRVDFLGLFLELAGLTLVEKLRRPLFAAPLFLLAFLSKQTLVLGAGAAILTLWRERRGDSVSLLTLYAALCGLSLLLIPRDNGAHLLDLLFRNNALQYSAVAAWQLAAPYLLTMALPLVWSAYYRASHPLWTNYLALTLLMLAGCGRIGAYFNHFLPMQAALSVVAGMSAAAAWQQERRCLLTALLLAQFCGVGFCAHLQTLAPLRAYFHEAILCCNGGIQIRMRDARLEVEELRQTLQVVSGPIVAENLALPVVIGRPSVLCDPITLFALADLHLWDATDFEERVRKQQFGCFILQKLQDNPRFPQSVLRLIQDHYVESKTVGWQHVLLPRSAHYVP